MRLAARPGDVGSIMTIAIAHQVHMSRSGYLIGR
jgi:hypothetical protein